MKLIEVNEGGLVFDDGSTLYSMHCQECCEEVYADFGGMQVVTRVEGNSVNSMDLEFFGNLLDSIVPIEGLGFYIVTKEGVCILVSCYNIQNGYYSNKLELVYDSGNLRKTKDITNCTGE